MQRFNTCLNEKINKNKPTEEEIFSYENWKLSPKNVSIEELANCLGQGMTVCPMCEDEEGVYYDLLIFDIDNNSENIISKDRAINAFRDAFDGVNPIISYPTFSDDGSYTRFRLIYLLENSLEEEDYRDIYSLLSYHFKFIDSKCRHAKRLFFGTNKDVDIVSEDFISNETIDLLLEKYESKKDEIANYFTRKMFKVPNKDLSYDDIELNYYLTDYAYENRNIYELIRSKVNAFDLIQDIYGKLDYLRHTHGNMYRCPVHGGDHGDNLKYYPKSDSFTCFSECDMYFDSITLLQIKYNTTSILVVYCKAVEDGYIEELDSRFISKKPPIKNRRKRRENKGSGEEAATSDEDTSKSDKNRLADALNFLNNLNWIDSKDKQEAYKEPGTELCTNGLKTSTLNFIIGDSNCGKSSVSFGMAYHLAYEPYVFFNEDMKVLEPVKSLIVNFETGYDHMKEGYPIIDDSISYINLSNQYEVTDDRIYLDDLNLIEAFFVKAKGEGRKLIIFDPLYRMSAEVDDAKRKELEPYLDNFRKLAKKYDICVIIILHTNRDSAKANARFGAAPDMSNVQGSIVINQIADTVIALYPVVNEDEEKDNINKKNAELKDRVRTTGFTFLKERGVAWRTYMIQWKTTKYFMEAKRCPRSETLNSKGEPRQRYDKNAKTKLYVEGVKERMPIDTIFTMGTLANWIHKDEEFKNMNIESTVSYLKNEFCSKIIDKLMEDGYLEQLDSFKYKKRK